MKVPESIIIVSHTMLYGAAHALRDYLLKKNVDKLLFISLPFYEQRIASSTSYKKGIVGEEVSVRRASFGVIDYLIDALQVAWWVYKQKSKFSLFIGINPINCIIGLFFRKIVKTKKVIFYAIDFTPKRFENSLLNYLYHKLEIYCVVHSDEVWNVSPRIAEGREQFLQIPNDPTHQIVVPMGIWNKNIKKRDFKDIKKHQLLFVGHLLEKQGVQLVLDAIPDIIRRIPDFKFIVVGGGEYLNILRKKAIDLHIEKHVKFLGWIKDRPTLDSMMSESACAIAIYKPEKEKLYNFTYYSDPTKLKDYLGAGLPIILTDVSYNALKIQEEKCGIIVDYETKSIAEAIQKLMGDEKLLKEYRKNALMYAEEFDWEKILEKALR